ncbi:hypothetical protein WA1_49035 [Scytonema hofmannii PCC 7110]|uniref:PEP-CTERM sorting domain-containing protein n=2 Tax=Scytonema hofmannii TaxID=34078 RepID=A0A139WU41_9CYAN|nr:hypothetical protein WA1_49035 [Scytonema hofmannii PCC 7110]
MKSCLSKLTITLAGVALGFAFEANPANAAKISFFVDGFSGGGSLSGFFSGTDSNGNGLIEFVPSNSSINEFDDFEANWSGNNIAPAFTQRLEEVPSQGELAELSGGYYALRDIPLQPNGNFFTKGELFLLSIVGSDLDSSTGFLIESYASPTASVGAPSGSFDSTNNPVVTKQVPEPATIGGTIAAGLLAALKKKLTAKKTEEKVTMN